jgi:hypothetical protein
MWTKKFGKEKQKWGQAYLKVKCDIKKLKTPLKTKFANKVIMFEETIEFNNVIKKNYMKQKIITLQ